MFLIMLEISLAQQSEELNPALESFAAHAAHCLPRASGGIRKCLERISGKTLMPVNVRRGGPRRENPKVSCAEPPLRGRRGKKQPAARKDKMNKWTSSYNRRERSVGVEVTAPSPPQGETKRGKVGEEKEGLHRKGLQRSRRINC